MVQKKLAVYTRLVWTAQDRAMPHKSGLTAAQQNNIDFCRTPRSLNEIAEMLALNNKRWVREKYLWPLIGSELALTLPDKPSSRYQKYQTIEK